MGLFDTMRLVRDTDRVNQEMIDAGVLSVQHIPGSSRQRTDALAASAARIDISDGKSAAITAAVARYARQWQHVAWDYFDAVPEVQYGFNALASASARATLCAGIVEDPTKPPITLTQIKDVDPYYQQVGGQTRLALERANYFLSELGKQLLKNAVLNISVAGEFYLTYMDDEWTVLSSEELVPIGTYGEILTETKVTSRNFTPTKWMVRRDRGRAPIPLDPDAYLARVWSAHPRWQQEPTSSMLGILDQCEALLLLDQMVRSTTRSRMFAGALYIPDTVSGPSDDAASIQDDITTAALTSITKEDAAFGVVPLVLTGPPEAGEQIKLIQISRGIDDNVLTLIDRTIDRILTGINLPKEFVKGMGSAKYANAVVISEGMYQLNIAPVLDAICEGLTKVYLRPRLIKDGISPALANRIVTGYDPTAIVNRPDMGQAANDGYDRKALSGAAWRTARGFSEADAPTDEELYSRFLIEKAQMPPDTAAASIEHMGGIELQAARRYVEKINASSADASGSPAATPREFMGQGQGSGQGEVMQPGAGAGPGSGSGQAQGPQVQAPTAPTEPLPPELQEILGPTEPQAETSTAPRQRNTVPGSNQRAGEMLPPRP